MLFGILNTAGSNFYFIDDYVFSDKTLGDLDLVSSAFVEKELRPSCYYTDLLPCDVNSKYRTVTGQCNNVQYPDLGKKNTVLKRLLPSKYDDGVSSPRGRSVVDGYNLPSPRAVSLKIHTA